MATLDWLFNVIVSWGGVGSSISYMVSSNKYLVIILCLHTCMVPCIPYTNHFLTWDFKLSNQIGINFKYIYLTYRESVSQNMLSIQQWCKNPQKKRYSGYDTKWNAIVRLHFRISEQCGVTLHSHYSQVHSDSEWLYLLRSFLWVK